MVSLPQIRNVFLDPAFLAALALGVGVPIDPPGPDPVPPRPDSAIVTNDLECGVAPQALDLCDQDIAEKISDFRQQDFGLPPIRRSRDLGGVAHDHVVDMINDNYIAVPTNDNPPRTLRTQLADGPRNRFCTFGQDPVINPIDTKAIIMVGCWNNNQVADIWNVMKSDPALLAIVLADWDRIGADVHHPDDIVVNPPPGLLKRNYWQFVFVKDRPGFGGGGNDGNGNDGGRGGNGGGQFPGFGGQGKLNLPNGWNDRQFAQAKLPFAAPMRNIEAAPLTKLFQPRETVRQPDFQYYIVPIQ